MQKQHLLKEKRIMNLGHVTMNNPNSLINRYANKTKEEIVANCKDKNGVLNNEAQRELSNRGVRVAYIEFHRYIYSLNDGEILNLCRCYKQYYYENQDDKYIYCDLSIIKDVMDYQLALRFDKWFSIQILEEIVQSYRQNLSLAKEYENITSDHLINFCKNLFSVSLLKKAGE